VLAKEDHRVVTAELNVRYRKATPTEVALLIRASLVRVEGSNLFLTAEIVAGDGTVLMEGDGRWRRLG
jgi:acyl-CoA thioesterase FadM